MTHTHMAKYCWPKTFDSYTNIKFTICYRARLFVAKPRHNTTKWSKMTGAEARRRDGHQCAAIAAEEHLTANKQR